MPEKSGVNELIESAPQIIFLNYSIKRNHQNDYQIELINKIVAEGRLKADEVPHQKESEDDLDCLTLDKDKRPLSIQTIPDPFTKRYEYPQEDGSLTSRQITLDSTVFSVRMQLDHASRYVAVKRSNPPGSSYLIITEIEEL